MKTAFRIILIVLTTLRLTRFITSDFLGEWTIVGPSKRWAWRKESGMGPEELEGFLQSDAADPVPALDPRYGWRSKLVKGLDCPFCVGFWIGGLVIVLSLFTKVPVIGPLLKLAASALSLNYLVGHVSSRIDG